MPELLCYIVRPDNTALWLPEDLMKSIGAEYGEKVTQDQINHPSIQRWISDHSKKKES